MPALKLAICVPCYGDPKALFMQSLFDAVQHMQAAKLANEKGEEYEVECNLFMVRSSMLTESRHRLVADAVSWGADYMLWCDADHIFPPDAIAKLWSRGRLVVGANYPRRCIPTAPTCAKIVTNEEGQDHRNLVYTTKDKAEAGLVEEVSHLGFGLVLIDCRVYDFLQIQAEKEGKPSMMPLFNFTPTDNYKGMIGEDVFFFRKVREAGIAVFCDHEVSWNVGHIHEVAMTNNDACKQEKAWTAQTAKLTERYQQRIKELEAAE